MRHFSLHAIAAAAIACCAWPAAAQTRPPVVFASQLPPAATPRAPLPQPYGSTFKADGTRVNDPALRSFVANPALAGRVAWRVDGNTATFDQGTVDRVVLNWDSFDIGAGYRVHFRQNTDPARYVSALNRIWSADPSVILGRLSADREVILLNANGVYFGRGARVDTGRFVASSLAIADAVFERGLRNVTDGSAVFTTAGTDYLTTNLNGAVSVEAGAEIRSAAGGDVLLIAPRVLNAGRIETPQGQAVLAAGDKVYLMSSSDPKQRGLIVAVDPVRGADGRPDATLGLAENAARGGTDGLVDQVNEIRADSGSVNLVGLAVRQGGVVNATTAVKGANGSVWLQAMSSTQLLAGGPDANTPASRRGLVTDAGSQVRVAGELGTVELAAGSVTAVTPSRSAATQIDAEVFNPSRIRVEGSAIGVAAGARLSAPGGQVELLATGNTVGNPLFDNALQAPAAADASRITIAPGAEISVAGVAGVAVDGARFQGAQRLFRIELADAPVQRSGALYRSPVLFDLRDGSRIAAANVAGAAAAIGRTAAERSTAGGSLRIEADGAVAVGEGARLDVSGGSVRYSPAVISNTLVSQGGRTVTFANAKADVPVDAVQGAVQQTPVPGDTEGAAGGSLLVAARAVALAGSVAAQVTQGERQRDGRSPPAPAASFSLGRAYGSVFQLAGIALVPGAAPATDGAWFSGDTAGVPATAVLSLPLLQHAGFGRVVLRAQAITQPAFGSLDLGLGGSFDAQGRTLALDGSYRLPGGRFAAVTPDAEVDADRSGDGDIAVSARTRIDAAGLFTNDNAGAAPVQLGGGEITLNAAHSLRIGSGALLDVSGGARLAGTGVKTGSAGSIVLATGTSPLLNPQLVLDGAQLAGYDFAGGGRLVVNAPATTIGAAADAPGQFTLPASFFGRGGFGSVALNATGDLRLAAGTLIEPQLLSWQFDAGWRTAASGAMADVATPARNDDRLAAPRPVNLALAATRPLAAGGGSLVVARGAGITLAPGGSLVLSATRNLEVGTGAGSAASTLSAQGGSIRLAIDGVRGSTVADGSGDPVGFLPTQALWLGNGARLDVSGTAQLRPDGAPEAGRSTGRVLGGGTITLAASRGYVVAEAGSSMRLDGAAAALNFTGSPEPVTLARSAGSLNVASSEGIVLDGAVSARAPGGADGGQLAVSLGAGGVYTATTGAAYDEGPRTVAMGRYDGLVAARGAAPGADLAAAFGNGTAWLRSSLVTGSGFAGLALAAGDRVRFDTSLAASLPLGLRLDAPALAAAPGVRLQFTAGSAQLGDGSQRIGALPDTAARPDASAARDTRLAVVAPVIEVFGRSGLQGFSTVALDAGNTPGGEIRIGAVAPRLNQPEGRVATLNFDGRLELTAGQIYATSASQAVIAGAGGSSRIVVRTGPDGAAANAPLSALGALTLSATDIDQGGVLRQPFGSLTLSAARSLLLAPGSITSVSGDGLVVPFGDTRNLGQWADGATTLPVAKSLALSAPAVDAAAGATVSARGGGDLQASEFFPGTGGSRDYLAAPGLYAVLPDRAGTPALGVDGRRLDAAAQGREVVITQPGSALAPGRYTAWPASYALLAGSLPQGAVLVSVAAAAASTAAQPVAQADGSTLVGGWLTRSGAQAGESPLARLLVEPAATFNAKSEQRLVGINALLAQQAAAGGSATPALPRDAGLVQVQLQDGTGGANASRWQSRLDLAAAGGGQAGRLDITAPALALLDGDAAAPAGSFAVGAGTLAASGAASVLLGGLRSADAAGAWRLYGSGTRSVTVDLGGRALALRELLLAAGERIDIATGTRIDATAAGSGASSDIVASGDGAFAAFSTDGLTLTRSGAALAAGTLTVGAGSTLAAQRLLLDATAGLQVDPAAALAAPSLALGAQRLVLGGAAPVAAGASAVGGRLLDTVRAGSDVSLRSYTSIDFAQDFANAPGATRLVLDTPLLRALDGAAVQLAAADVALRNGSGLAAPANATGSGTLELRALPPLRWGSTGGLTLGPGSVTLAFDVSTLRSGGDIVLAGSGGTAAQGALLLSAARVTAATGADQRVAAAGALRIVREPGSRTLGERAGVGANVVLAGATVQHDGRIDLPGGALRLEALRAGSDGNALSFGAGSVTSVAGYRLVNAQDDSVAFGPAGSIVAAAAQGAIALAGTLDAAAAAQGDGGSIALQAAGSGGALALADSAVLRLSGGSAAGDLGGRLATDVQTLQRADTLARAATAAGASREFTLRVRQGDVALDADIAAARIAIAADAGRLAIGAARLDASGGAGGVVQLAAGGDLTLGPAARIDARAAAAGANGAATAATNTATNAPTNGGDVLLATTVGRLRLNPAATIDARGDDAQDGRIVLRAPRGSDNRSIAIDPLTPAALAAAEVDIEAVRSYTNVTAGGVTRDITAIAAGNSAIAGSGASRTGTLGINAVRSDNNAFMANAATVLTSLGVPAAETQRVLLRAGTEVRASGDLALAADWALNATADRPGGDAGFITLRAAGNLALNGSLSDGFSTATTAGVLNDNARSWSLRLAAGADLGAANPLAVRDLSAAAADSGNLTLGAGRLLRTGAGSLEVAAGRDIRLGTGAAAYVAGRKLAGQADLLSALFAGQAAKPGFTEQGGRVELAAARDITAPEATQLVNNWLWRSGLLSPAGDGTYASASQLAWWTQFNRMQQSLASFGGGALTVRAGRDIVNLQAMAPTAGWADGRNAATATVRVVGGGDVTVEAGRDVVGGQFLLGRGSGRVAAGRDVAGAADNARLQRPVVALLDGQWRVDARNSLVLGGAFDPTAAPVPLADNRAVVSGWYTTQGPGSGVALTAQAGTLDVVIEPSQAQLGAFGLQTAGGADTALRVLPASFAATAASGSLTLLASGQPGAVMLPAERGQLALWAGGDIALGGTATAARWAMSDSSPAAWPGAARPVAAVALTALVANTLDDTLPLTGLHAGDREPVRIHADGAVAIRGSAPTSTTLLLPKPLALSAGTDVLELSVRAQNLVAGDTTTVVAGRNLEAGLVGRIDIGGPGLLDASAGRNVDLGASPGITTTGNERNAALPASGAAVRLAASTAGTLDAAALESQYLAEGSNPRWQRWRELLASEVNASLAGAGLGYEAALQAFRRFPATAQAAFGRKLLAAEFSAVYLLAEPPTAAQVKAELQAAFERRKAQVLKAGDDALAAGQALTLPGRETLAGAALSAWLDELRALDVSRLDIDAVAADRAAQRAAVRDGWRAVSPTAADLADTSSARFERYRREVLTNEMSGTAAAASLFGRKSLPMRLALFDQGFLAAELSGVGSFAAQPVWPAQAAQSPLLQFAGSLDLTQSAVVTRRGGGISLLAPGGAVNVGLKATGTGSARGVIALGGGDVFGYAKDDFQVNTQRVFIVGSGEMTIWSSRGDIDSGRGANTAVAAPPLAARRAADGVVFEVPATTSGSGLAILEDAAGRRSGTIGLYPAFGEILALDAYIRAPSLLLGAAVRGADNLIAASVGGAAAAVSAPPPAVAAPAASTADTRAAEAAAQARGSETRPRNSLLTVELTGLGDERDDCPAGRVRNPATRQCEPGR